MNSYQNIRISNWSMQIAKILHMNFLFFVTNAKWIKTFANAFCFAEITNVHFIYDWPLIAIAGAWNKKLILTTLDLSSHADTLIASLPWQWWRQQAQPEWHRQHQRSRRLWCPRGHSWSRPSSRATCNCTSRSRQHIKTSATGLHRGVRLDRHNTEQCCWW